MISVSAREPSNCLTDAKVTSLIADFTTNAAEHTDYKGVTKRVLTSDFTSISGSVNFADGIPVSTFDWRLRPIFSGAKMLIFSHSFIQQ